jgi:Ser/Thr protein kinase RdoA (MazF antagonist)
MSPTHPSLSALKEWKTILGDQVQVDHEFAWRDLWLLTTDDGTQYFLKRLSPWRNLPLADECRIVQHLARQGIRVPEFISTDCATLYASEGQDAFVLLPKLANDQFSPAELVALEETIGRAVAELHLALAGYPWPSNSYAERVDESLQQELTLPPEVADGFARRRGSMIDALVHLPTQLVHGDLSPENILLQRPEAVSGFIDFDHLPQAPRIWDISKYLSRRIRLNWRKRPSASNLGRLDHLAGFLRGYHQVNPLTPGEIRAIPAGIAAANVLEASYFREILDGTLSRRTLPNHGAMLADTVEAAEWHLANYDEVVYAVLSSMD